MENKEGLRIIISGGGTGGHIFPAIAIADALRRQRPDCELLFVGALGRMEMERVPAAGYSIVGLPVAGFQRSLSWKNVTFFFKLAASMLKARRLVKSFKPQVAIGVGGYASGPVLRAAAARGVLTVLQEQNSYPGVTNRILARKAALVCVAYPQMERFFPSTRLVFTGNPLREALLQQQDRKAAAAAFGLDPNRPTLLVVGGSLGARSINEGIVAGLALLKESGVQVLWQTGKLYYEALAEELKGELTEQMVMQPFIGDMAKAYALADVVVSRAGAGTISELSALGKAVVLVPSPNVAEDHQTKNAMSLVERGAAVMVKDAQTKEALVQESLVLLNDKERLTALSKAILEFARPRAADDIALEVLNLIAGKQK